MNLFKKTLFLAILFLTNNLFGQLDSIHYLPPLKQASSNAGSAMNQQQIYFSTPETNSININIYQGTNSTPIATITNLSNGSPKEYNPGSGINNMTSISNSNTGIINTTGGLRFESQGGEKFYVNFRARSSAQAGSLTCKGTAALGKEFRWGGIPNRATKNGHLNSCLGIIATENGTEVKIFGYDTDCEFRLGNDNDGLLDDTLIINLNSGESFVVEAVKETSTANDDGWLGSKIISNKPIAIACGGFNYGVITNSANRDIGMDQPVPIEKLGKEYVFIRGKGTNSTEIPLIIGTQNGTDVYVGGVLIGTINDMEYLEIPASNFSSSNAGGNMFVETSKDVYAYQCLGGQSAQNSIGINFIPPLNCLLPSNLNQISSIHDIAGLNSGESAITIVASTATLNSNITVTDGSGNVSLPASNNIVGTGDWKTFYITNLNGEVSVNSTGPIAVGFFMRHGGAAGLAGYFSGFDTAPNAELEINGGGCFPNGLINEISGNFDDYQWFIDNIPIANADSGSITPSTIGDYYVEVTKGTCTYSSKTVSLYYCNPELVVTKTDDVDPINEGDTVTFTIKIESKSINPITNLVVTENLPTEFTLLSATPSSGNWTNPDWNVGTILAGEVLTLSVKAIANSGSGGSTPNNTIFHTQDQTDNNIEVDDSNETVTINVLLPIDLVSFNVKLNKNNQSVIFWETVNEINNHFFTIEKSNNAKSWEVLKTILGSGNSSVNKSYKCIDEKPIIGTNYYRLKQTDFDGNYSYSPIKTINLKPYLNFGIYPNPAKTLLSIKGTNLDGATLRIVNMLGVVYSSKKISSEFHNVLDISKLPVGAYCLSTNKNGKFVYTLFNKVD